MIIVFSAVNFIEGKVKYIDSRLIALEEKAKPAKVTPYFAEFIKDDFVKADVIVIPKANILDLLILDIEKFETRMERTADEGEREAIRTCLKHLEKEEPLFSAKFNSKTMEYLQVLAPLSLKPVVIINPPYDINSIIKTALEKSDTVFFYTSGPKEVHAWPVQKGSDIVACAGKIHTDLARGFIKADIAGYDDFLKCHNMNDAKTRGIAKVVDRDYIIKDGDIIEIRYNV